SLLSSAACLRVGGRAPSAVAPPGPAAQVSGSGTSRAHLRRSAQLKDPARVLRPAPRGRAPQPPPARLTLCLSRSVQRRPDDGLARVGPAAGRPLKPAT